VILIVILLIANGNTCHNYHCHVGLVSECGDDSSALKGEPSVDYINRKHLPARRNMQ
jgi:hypothetical protein